jgi:hypothetical protein
MEVRFLPALLRRLDDANVELCACSIWIDERPMKGFAALLDWRMGGRLSALLKSGFVKGELGEAVIVPGKPHVSFEKVLLVGLGPRTTFNDSTFRTAIVHLARTLERLRVRRAVVELPGRSSEAIDPERAITLTLECVGASPEHDAWWVVDKPAAQEPIEARAADERRRARAL